MQGLHSALGTGCSTAPEVCTGKPTQCSCDFFVTPGSMGVFWVHRVCSLCLGKDVLLPWAVPSVGFLVENKQATSLLVKQIDHLHAYHVDAHL